MKKKIILTSLALIIILAVIAYMVYGYYQKQILKVQRPLVTMEIENYGTVEMELYPEMAPNTVRNFIKLINDGYYNGLIFHRVEESLIQGGDKEGTGAGVTDYSIEGEFSENGHKENTLSFERGTLGLARKDFALYYYYTGDESYLTQGYNSGCTQFFITAEDCSQSFDGYYCAFGKVTEGMEVIEAIKVIETVVETDEETGEESTTSKPVNPPVITKMTVDTFGIEYNEPEKIIE